LLQFQKLGLDGTYVERAEVLLDSPRTSLAQALRKPRTWMEKQNQEGQILT
jgi:hypothetical protein